MYFVLPEYPEAARKAQKQGVVSAVLILNAAGEVKEVRVQSGDPALASVVQAAVKQWRFTAGRREESIPMSVKFVLSDRPIGLVTGASLLNPVIVAKAMR
jgi:TonB family protein